MSLMVHRCLPSLPARLGLPGIHKGEMELETKKADPQCEYSLFIFLPTECWHRRS